MKTLGAIIRMCYGIGWLLCIVALFFPEGNVFRELAIYILLTVSVFNWYKEYKSWWIFRDYTVDSYDIYDAFWS